MGEMIEKLDGTSMNLEKKNIEKLKELFPNIVTDGKVDFEMLRLILGDEIEESREKYQFTWNGKAQAIKTAQMPSSSTLRPCFEKSKEWSKTQNLYIEGDNLEVLKQLQKTYHGKIKMIYIDPPYNTGHDFVYRDDFTESINSYRMQTDQMSKSNPETSGRFHTDWLNMIYPRLLLSRNLLSDDGILYISIDDNEQDTLKKICNEIFGESNYVAQLVWEKKKKGSFLSNSITNIKEYVLVYCKNVEFFEGLIGDINNNTETYPCINAVNKRELRRIPAGIISKYKELNYFMPKGSEISDTTMSIILHSDLVIKNGVLASELILEGNWRYSQDAMTEYANKKEIYITRDLYLRRIVNDVRNKTLKDILPRVGEDTTISHKDEIDLNNLSGSGWGSNEDADEELRLLFGIQKIMDYPKPSRLLIKLLAAYRNTKNSIILDFFSGSATTAHAVMWLNSKDNGKRKYIMVQLPEKINSESVSYGQGYSNLCEIGEERIRRAGEKIKKEWEEKTKAEGIFAEGKEFPVDIGFKVFKLDSSNIETWDNERELNNEGLLQYSNEVFKEGRSKEDVLYEIMLKYGIFDREVSEIDINGKTMYQVGKRYMIVCLEDDLDVKDIVAIGEKKPNTVVFKESGFKDDNAKINAIYNLKKQGVEDIKCI